MQIVSYQRQAIAAKVLVYSACWMGTGLGLFWVWQGILQLQPHVVHNRYANSMLLVLGLIVWAGVYGLYKMSRATAVLLLIYAIIQELLLQQYNYSHFHYIQFKPYFPYEVIALVIALIGVFWYHWAEQKQAAKKSHTARKHD